MGARPRGVACVRSGKSFCPSRPGWWGRVRGSAPSCPTAFQGLLDPILWAPCYVTDCPSWHVCSQPPVTLNLCFFFSPPNREKEKQGERKSENPSMLCTVSVEPDAGLGPTHHEIVT